MGTLLALSLVPLLLNRFPLSAVALFMDRRAAANAEGLRKAVPTNYANQFHFLRYHTPVHPGQHFCNLTL